MLNKLDPLWSHGNNIKHQVCETTNHRCTDAFLEGFK